MKQAPAPGFTLIDMMLALVIAGILAAIVIPRYGHATDDAIAAALQSNLKTARGQIKANHALNGVYPPTIDPDWFADNDIPEHPQNKSGLPDLQVLGAAGVPHPVNKVLKSGVLGAYWYNPIEGTLQARVAAMSTEQATMDFYNRVNGSSETTLGNYTGGGGGS